MHPTIGLRRRGMTRDARVRPVGSGPAFADKAAADRAVHRAWVACGLKV
jgi:hypothetical protein